MLESYVHTFLEAMCDPTSRSARDYRLLYRFDIDKRYIYLTSKSALFEMTAIDCITLNEAFAARIQELRRFTHLRIEGSFLLGTP